MAQVGNINQIQGRIGHKRLCTRVRMRILGIRASAAQHVPNLGRGKTPSLPRVEQEGNNAARSPVYYAALASCCSSRSRS